MDRSHWSLGQHRARAEREGGALPIHGGLIVDLTLQEHSRQIVDLALKGRLPTVSGPREFAEAGGLMSYGNRLAEVYRLVGLYIGRILKGEKPIDLPVQQSTKFELVINLKAAKALDLAVPNLLLVSADEVIE